MLFHALRAMLAAAGCAQSHRAAVALTGSAFCGDLPSGRDADAGGRSGSRGRTLRSTACAAIRATALAAGITAALIQVGAGAAPSGAGAPASHRSGLPLLIPDDRSRAAMRSARRMPLTAERAVLFGLFVIVR
jgi:hypothetical protein